MHDISRTTAAGILLVPLLVFVIVRGIVPACTVVQSDFPNYYTAGLIARTGAGVDRLYDDAWFQQEIERAGIAQQGKFSPFPPTTALLFIPFSYLDPLNALRLMTLLNIAFLISAIVIVRKVFFRTFIEAATFVLLAGLGLSNGFRLGQLYIALSLTILLGYYLQRRGCSALAGLSAGLLMPVKYFSVILIADAALRKNRNMVVWGVTTSVMIGLLSVGLLGWSVHRQFLEGVLSGHLTGTMSGQNPYSPLFQSFDSLFRRMFLFDGELNPHPLIASAGLFRGLKIVCILAVIAGGAYAIKASHRQAPDISLAVLSIAALLIAPATATYHFVLLWLPVGIMLRHFSDRNNDRWFYAMLVCYSGIGFIPYSQFVRFDGHGLLTLLAYPRLLLLGVLFAIVVSAAIRLPDRVTGENASSIAVQGGMSHDS